MRHNIMTNAKLAHTYVDKQYTRARLNVIKSNIPPATQATIMTDLQKASNEWATKSDDEIKKQTTEINRIDGAIDISKALNKAQDDIQTMAAGQMTAVAPLLETLPKLEASLNAEWAKVETILEQKRTEIKNKV